MHNVFVFIAYLAVGLSIDMMITLGGPRRDFNVNQHMTAIVIWPMVVVGYTVFAFFPSMMGSIYNWAKAKSEK